MRHGSAGRRHRNRGHAPQGGNGNNNGSRRGNHNRMQVFDSNGPEVRIRGTAYQVVEKYLAMAKDAASAGDRVLSESYLQHAEHYQRIINSWEDDVHTGRPHYVSSDQLASEEGVERSVAMPVHNPDLSLPASILGGVPKSENQDTGNVRTVEMAT